MFDDDKSVACVDELVQDGEEFFDIVEVEAGSLLFGLFLE